MTKHVILERQRAVSFMMNRAMNYHSLFASHLSKISDVTKLILSIKKAESQARDWMKLRNSLAEAVQMSGLIDIMLEQIKEDDMKKNVVRSDDNNNKRQKVMNNKSFGTWSFCFLTHIINIKMNPKTQVPMSCFEEFDVLR